MACASQGNWFRLKDKNEAPSKRDGQWFALVALGGEMDRPRFYLIPRDHVAAMVYVEHREWLMTPGKGGKPHKENDQRNLSEADVKGYLERWELLERPTDSVPLLGDERFAPLIDRHGLPPGHLGCRQSRSQG